MPLLSSKILRVVLLPLGLSLGVVLGLGSFCETNDDQHFALLFRGLTAAVPVPALPLYFHGLGHGLRALYTAGPAVPWLGLLLAALLLLATILVFAVLDKLLRPHLRPAALVLALLGFFLLGWLEHWLWFSHLRVALLLAGGAVLFAAQRPGQKGPLLASLGFLLLAWAIRPSAAVLGAVAAAPAALLLAGGGRRAWPVLLGAAATLALATLALTLSQSPAAAQSSTLDRQLAAVLDYGLRRPAPRTPADSLTVAAVDLWLLGDATVVNAPALRRAFVPDWPHYLTQVLPAKLTGRLALLARDYFALLLALLGTAGWAARRRENRRTFLLLQAGLGGLLLALATLLKLPPRLALPLLDCWLLANLAAALAGGRRPENRREATGAGLPLPAGGWRRLAFGLAGLVCALYGAKTWHRRLVLRQEQGRHEQALREVAQKTSGQIRVVAGADEWLKSLSPFRTYSLGPGPVLWLTGWPAHDPSQPQRRRQLTGTADQAGCLRALASRPAGQVAWLLTAPAHRWLNRRLWPHSSGGDSTTRRRPGPLRPGAAMQTDSTLRFYNIALAGGV